MNDHIKSVNRGGGRKQGRPFKWIIVAFGLIVACTGAGFLYSSYTFLQTAVSATGTVLSVETTRERKRNTDGDWEDSVTHQPTLRYTGVDGVERQVKTSMSSSNYDFVVGTEVSIYVDPGAPETVRINDFMSNWGFGGIFLAFGLILSALGLFLKKRDGVRSR